VKENIEDGYLGILEKEQGRDIESFSLTYVRTRQRFKYGGMLDDNVTHFLMSLYYCTLSN